MIKNLAIGSSNRGLLFLSLVLGMVFAVSLGIYLSSLDSESGSKSSGSTATVPVVVASVDIPALTTLTPEMLTVKEVPADLVLAGAFSDLDTVVGKKTQAALVAGQQILPTNATDADVAQDLFGPDAPLSLVIPEGKVAFSILVSKVASVGGLARPGDHVDLLSSQEVSDSEGQSTTTSTCVLLQDVQILAIGDSLLRAGGDTAAIASVGTNPDANTMTLAVTPDQAVALANAQGSVSGDGVGSQLWVSLRAYGDTNVATNVPACSAPAQ